ncbi:hypothetical protein TRVL_06735 [Trypanosoma vivax]|nr:hypothetical protein TRVL_06735 [Trypanosoma vivax]
MRLSGVLLQYHATPPVAVHATKPPLRRRLLSLCSASSCPTYVRSSPSLLACSLALLLSARSIRLHGTPLSEAQRAKGFRRLTRATCAPSPMPYPMPLPRAPARASMPLVRPACLAPRFAARPSTRPRHSFKFAPLP